MDVRHSPGSSCKVFTSVVRYLVCSWEEVQEAAHPRNLKSGRSLPEQSFQSNQGDLADGFVVVVMLLVLVLLAAAAEAHVVGCYCFRRVVSKGQGPGGENGF
jgi:hypothetical protein